jgi:hypothetical protein
MLPLAEEIAGIIEIAARICIRELSTVRELLKVFSFRIEFCGFPILFWNAL